MTTCVPAILLYQPCFSGSRIIHRKPSIEIVLFSTPLSVVTLTIVLALLQYSCHTAAIAV